jgi:hypothetical protein
MLRNTFSKGSIKLVDDVDFNMPEDEKGSYTDIVINGVVHGRAIRTRKSVKPIFISCGEYIYLKSSTDIALNLANNISRVPIPTRLADLETHISRRELSSLHNNNSAVSLQITKEKTYSKNLK